MYAPMPAARFPKALNGQIANEFGASQQYTAIAVNYDSETLPQLASYFYRQALEERNHAMMMVQYLLDAGLSVKIPAVAEPRNEFANAVEPIQLALEQERRVSEQIGALALLARKEGDYSGEQFMQWFIKEQVEEVASISSLLTTVQRAGDSLLLVEDHLARAEADEEADPTAPQTAGGAL